VSAPGAKKERDSLSLQTLVIAAVASGCAAIVTSYFWHGGAFVTASITPVIVALVKEGLQRPIESDVMRRPVRRFTSSRTQAPAREPVYSGTGGRSGYEEPPRELTPFGAPPAADLGPIRTYGRPRARRWHVKAAIVTGLVAFAIAALVLTVPELVFGGSVSGHGKTTFFSTQRTSTSTSHKSNQQKTSTDSGQTDTNQQTTPPSQDSQGSGTTPQVQQSPPAQQTPQGGGTTAPQQAPAPAAPPAAPSP
jgi:hypothetical protein